MEEVVSSDKELITQKAVGVFRECAKVPTLSSATVVDAGGGKYEVLTKWSQRDLERGKKVTFSRSHFVEKNGEKVDRVASSSHSCGSAQQLVSTLSIPFFCLNVTFGFHSCLNVIFAPILV